jgi:hypothetical protein
MTNRRGYDLFHNKVARAEAKAKGITRKNYDERIMTFDAETGGEAQFQDWVPEKRINNLSKFNGKLLQKMKSHRISLSEACTR